MKKAIGMLFVAATLVAGSASIAAAQTSDRTLHERIDKQIDSTSLKKFDIKVSVDSGVATLTGTVATEAERTRAGHLAAVAGISRVDNHLSVDAGAAEHTRGTMGTVEAKTKEGVSKTGEEITDGWITTRVHSKFVGEELLKGSSINVDTSEHVVTLRGTVTSEAGRRRAVEQAGEVEGVHRVVDQLRIGPKQ